MSVDSDNSIFIKCACEGEGMSVDYDPKDDYYYFSYWSYGLSNRKMSWREKIRYCWQVLWNSRPFNDELMLTKDQAIRLENFLLSRNREKF